jgi:hypothetical protein
MLQRKCLNCLLDVHDDVFYGISRTYSSSLQYFFDAEEMSAIVATRNQLVIHIVTFAQLAIDTTKYKHSYTV